MRSLEIMPLSEQLQKVAIEELGEVTARIPQDLLALRSWIEKQPHLRARTDDQFLIQFLRGSKYSLEKAKQKLDNYFTLKTKWSDLFLTTDVMNADFRKYHNKGCCLPLPKPLNDNGARIMFHRFEYEPNDFTAEQVLQYGSAVTEIIIQNDPYACINGVLYVFDFGSAKAGHLLAITLELLKKLTSFYMKSLPLRIKGICFFNLSPYAEQITKMVLPFAPEKLKQRIIFCGKNIDNMAQLLPRKYFPIEYGGENGSIEQIISEYHAVWDAYQEHFKQNAQYGTDEHLRIDKKMQFDELLGCGGSFRKLEVD